MKEFGDVCNLINEYIQKVGKNSLRILESEPVYELNLFMRKVKEISCNNKFVTYLTNSYSPQELSILRDILLTAECVVEYKSTDDYINGNKEIIDEKIQRASTDIVDEGSLLCLNEFSSVLLIGSGAMPLTGIVLNKVFSSSITCIDIDSNALELSKKMVLAVSDYSKFQFIKGDINEFRDFQKFTHLIITGFIYDKKNLLLNMYDYVDTQKILVRNPIGFYRFVYGWSDSFPGYKIISNLEHDGRMPYTSLVLEKEKR